MAGGIVAVIVAALGVLVAAFGLLGLVRPVRLIDSVRRFWESSAGMPTAIGIRIVFGVALLAAASDSRFPTALQVFGILSLAAAAALPIVGSERLGGFIRWWADHPPGLIRAWCLAAVGFGLFLVHAVV